MTSYVSQRSVKLMSIPLMALSIFSLSPFRRSKFLSPARSQWAVAAALHRWKTERRELTSGVIYQEWDPKVRMKLCRWKSVLRNVTEILGLIYQIMGLPNSAETTPVHRLTLCINTAACHRLHHLQETVSVRETPKVSWLMSGFACYHLSYNKIWESKQTISSLSATWGMSSFLTLRLCSRDRCFVLETNVANSSCDCWEDNASFDECCSPAFCTTSQFMLDLKSKLFNKVWESWGWNTLHDF